MLCVGNFDGEKSNGIIKIEPDVKWQNSAIFRVRLRSIMLDDTMQATVPTRPAIYLFENMHAHRDMAVLQPHLATSECAGV